MSDFDSQLEGRTESEAPRLCAKTVDQILTDRRLDYGRPVFADADSASFGEPHGLTVSQAINLWSSLPVNLRDALRPRRSEQD